jgi:D-galacturonate reductase
MNYAPDEEGHFGGQGGYGYVSIEKFIDYCQKRNDNEIEIDEIDSRHLPTIKNTVLVTAILEAGRRSLDQNKSIELAVVDGEWAIL